MNAEEMFAAERGIYIVHNRFVDESDRLDWLEGRAREEMNLRFESFR